MKSNYILFMILGVICVSTLNVPVFGEDDTVEIPVWIKQIAGYWVEGSVSDERFVEILEFLLEHEIIKIPGYGKINIQEENNVPVTLTITTDKETYTSGERIHINGTIPNEDLDTIGFLMINPSEFIASIHSVSTSGINEYTASWELGGSGMTESGIYTIQVKYQGEIKEMTIEYNTK